MQGDFTRWTFDPGQAFRSVLLQQGRVLLDADFNEQTEITARHDEVRTGDLVGRSGGPATGAGFAIVDDAGAPPAGTRWADLRITPGTYYVDGILAEAAAPPSPNGDAPAGWRLADQPYLQAIGATPGLAEPSGDGRYALYLDVWTHHVTADEEPRLREAALGGPDTTTRARTVWQVRVVKLDAEECSDLHAAASAGRTAGTMTAGLQEQPPGADPCQITASGGYRRLENQLYRVQIHDTSGPLPTFVWSRENGSVVARLTAISTPSQTPGMAADLLLDRVGRDDELSILTGDTVEVTSTDWELHGRPGRLAVAGAPDGLRLPVTWVAAPVDLSELGSAPIVRRWDGPARDIAVGPSELEGGIQVAFQNGAGRYRSGDHWLVPARAVRLAYGLSAAPGTIDWPVDGSGAPVPRPPLGPVHHVTPLAILVRTTPTTGPIWTLESDCRPLFAQLTEQVTLDLLGGDGQEAMPGRPLPQPVRLAVHNGGLPLPGARVRITAGSGGHVELGSAPTSSSQSSLVAVTDPAGVVEVRWLLGQPGPSTQTLTALRLDDHDADLDPAIVVTGRHSVAAEVAWAPVCDGFAEARTVQEALGQLATTRELRLLGGDGQTVPQGRVMVPQPVRVVLDSPCGPVGGATVVAISAGQQGLVAAAKEGEPTPNTLGGTGATFEARARTGPDGVAAFFWQPDFASGPSRTLSIFHGDGTDAPVTVGAQEGTSQSGPAGPRVTAVRVGTTALPNGGTTLPGILAGGVRVVFEGSHLRPDAGHPQLVHVSLDLPFATTAPERAWAAEAIGYHAVELAGTVTMEPESLLWTPTAAAKSFITNGMWDVLGRKSAVTGWVAVEEWALAPEPVAARGRYLQWFELSPPALVPVPDVVGRARATAERALAEAGLATTVEEATDASVRKGLVISTEPASGAGVAPGATVTVRVSAGRAP